MLGMTTNDAFAFFPQKDVDFGVDLCKRDAVWRTKEQNLFAYHRAETFHALADRYTDWTDPKRHPASIRSSLMNSLNDGLFTAPAVQVARFHAGHNEVMILDVHVYGII